MTRPVHGGAVVHETQQLGKDSPLLRDREALGTLARVVDRLRPGQTIGVEVEYTEPFRNAGWHENEHVTAMEAFVGSGWMVGLDPQAADRT
jgi:hypothetical protein